MDILIGVGIIVGVLIIAFAGIWAKRKFNIKDNELAFMTMIFQLANMITSNIDFKYQKGVCNICRYVLRAIALVINFDGVEGIENKVDVIIEQAKEICVDNGIELDDEILNLIDSIIIESFILLGYAE